MKEQPQQPEYKLPTNHPSKDILLKRADELTRRAIEEPNPIEAHNLTQETERLKERAKSMGKLIYVRPVLKFDFIAHTLEDGSVITRTGSHIYPKHFEVVETESQYLSLEVVGVDAYQELRTEVESYF